MGGRAKAGAALKHPPAPRLAQGAFGKLRSMSLSSTDAYVLSRIDGVTLAHEIVDACGLDAGTVTEIVNRLTAMGLIRWDHEGPKGSAAPSDEPGRRVSATRMSTKRNIVSVQPPAPGLLERFEALTHYQLLGLYSDCSHDEVERGHVRARDLEEGTLAARLAARLGTRRVLRGVAAAYEVLRSPERRQKYDEYLLYREETRAIEDALSEGVRRASLVPPPARASTPVLRASERGILGEGLSAPGHAQEAKIAAYYLVAALRKHVPSGARRSRAEGLVRSAIAERDSDNLVGATNALRLASSIVPDCDALESALATITNEMNKSLAPTFRAQAMYEENLQMWEAAAKTWEKVLLGQPDDAHAARGVAEALLAAGGDLKRARRRGEEAVKNAPEDAECQRTLGRVYIAAGMTNSAERAFNIADDLESQEDNPRGLLSRVRARWSRG
jgi:tetratricopeptide (TPR) repeat protein